MSTSAAFFVGEGNEGRFLGGHCSDGYIQEHGQRGGIPQVLLRCTTEEEFGRSVQRHLRKVSEDDRLQDLTWVKAKGVHYLYAFFEGHVWVTNGGRWYNDYIPANIHPSKRTPSAPVNRVGKLGVDIEVQCGQCQNRNRLDHREFDKIEREEWSMADIFGYFKSQGWKASEDQGWLCRDCQS